MVLAAIPILCAYALVVSCYPLWLDPADLFIYRFVTESTYSVGPGGDRVRLALNDAGAAHSGQHYQWVLYRRSGLLPWRILASGWSEKRAAEEAIRWVGPRSFEVELAAQRWAQEHDRIRVRLP